MATNKITLSPKSRVAAIIFCLCSMIFSGCKKTWFDAKSDKNLSVPATLKEFQQLMDNYQVFNERTPGLGEVASDGKFATENGWDFYYLNSKDYPRQAEANAFTWSKMYNLEKSPEWTRAHHLILNCNIVLEGLKRIDSSSDISNYNQIQGAALFYRAKTLFDLAQIYAEPYESSENSKFGLQLRESPDVTQTTPRSSVHETYSFLINTLKQAAAQLPVHTVKLSRPSKLSSWALLCRVYLVMGDFDSAKKYADSTIQNALGLINYHDLSIGYTSFPLFNTEVLFLSTMEEYLLYYLQDAYQIDTSFYNLYSENDARKKIYFIKMDDGSILYNGSYTNSIHSIPFSGIGLNEIYLNRAECYAQLGNLTEAANDINALLTQRYHKKEDGSSYFELPEFASKNDILQYIYQERFKELPFRGIRWIDLRRKSIDLQFKKAITRIVGGNTSTLEPNSNKFTLGIPNNEISMSGIEQNPGWDN